MVMQIINFERYIKKAFHPFQQVVLSCRIDEFICEFDSKRSSWLYSLLSFFQSGVKILVYTSFVFSSAIFGYTPVLHKIPMLRNMLKRPQEDFDSTHLQSENSVSIYISYCFKHDHRQFLNTDGSFLHLFIQERRHHLLSVFMGKT